MSAREPRRGRRLLPDPAAVSGHSAVQRGRAREVPSAELAREPAGGAGAQGLRRPRRPNGCTGAAIGERVEEMVQRALDLLDLADAANGGQKRVEAQHQEHLAGQSRAGRRCTPCPGSSPHVLERSLNAGRPRRVHFAVVGSGTWQRTLMRSRSCLK